MKLALLFFALFLVTLYTLENLPLYWPLTTYAQNQQQKEQPPKMAAPENPQEEQESRLQENNKLFIVSLVQEVINKHNITALDKYYAPGIIQHNPVASQGRQGLRQFFEPFLVAVPDIHVTIEHILAENHVVLVFLNWTGTHKGEFEGIPATNKTVNLRTADLFRIDNNGTIAEQWDVVNPLDFLQQVGALTLNLSKAE
jgi:steroid delta-isomerase-like uncharacterized protein